MRFAGIAGDDVRSEAKFAVRRSVPGIAGQQRADSTAAILSAARLCEHHSVTGQALRIERAATVDLLIRLGARSALSTAKISDDLAGRVSG